jgi:hypothetical protein
MYTILGITSPFPPVTEQQKPGNFTKDDSYKSKLKERPEQKWGLAIGNLV